MFFRKLNLPFIIDNYPYMVKDLFFMQKTDFLDLKHSDI